MHSNSSHIQLAKVWQNMSFPQWSLPGRGVTKQIFKWFQQDIDLSKVTGNSQFLFSCLSGDLFIICGTRFHKDIIMWVCDAVWPWFSHPYPSLTLPCPQFQGDSYVTQVSYQRLSLLEMLFVTSLAIVSRKHTLLEALRNDGLYPFTPVGHQQPLTMVAASVSSGCIASCHPRTSPAIIISPYLERKFYVLLWQDDFLTSKEWWRHLASENPDRHSHKDPVTGICAVSTEVLCWHTRITDKGRGRAMAPGRWNKGWGV